MVKPVRKCSEKSKKIYNLSFFMMLGIVWSHSRLPHWNVVPNYFNHLALFNEIGQDAVAPFFLITGFLFFRNFKIDDYLIKLKTRLHTLIIPYLIWNCIGALLWFSLIQTTGHRYVSDNYFFDSKQEIIVNILACSYTILWYVGVIIIYALAAPLFYLLSLNKRIAVISVILFFLIGISTHHPFASPLLWMSIYMMGAFLGTYYPDFLYKPVPKWITWTAIVLFPLCVWYNYEYDSMLSINLRHWFSVFFYFGLYDLFDIKLHFKKHNIYKYSFFLYATHYFPLHVAQRFIISNINNEAACWLAYLVVPPIVVIFCVLFAYLLDKKIPYLYKLLGGR